MQIFPPHKLSQNSLDSRDSLDGQNTVKTVATVKDEQSRKLPADAIKRLMKNQQQKRPYKMEDNVKHLKKEYSLKTNLNLDQVQKDKS